MLTFLQSELSKYFIGVNMIYTGLTGSKNPFSHASKGIFALASSFGLPFDAEKMQQGGD